MEKFFTNVIGQIGICSVNSNCLNNMLDCLSKEKVLSFVEKDLKDTEGLVCSTL